MTSWNLRITDRRGRAKMHTLGALPLILGRDETLPIPLDDAQTSRRHCQIEACDEKTLRVSDLGSTNGTLLNGRKITRAVVNDGDRIKIGETIIEFITVKDVEVEDDTGLRRLSILKSFSTPKKEDAAIQKEDEKAAVLSRIGVASGQAVVNPTLQQRIALIADIASMLIDDINLNSAFEFILGGLIQVYPIDRAAILKWNEEKKSLEPSLSKIKDGASGGVVVSRTICQHIINSKEAIVTENAMVDPRFSSGDSIIENRIGSIVAAPIMARNSFFGILYACTEERAAVFTDSDLSFLILIGNLIALTMILSKVKASD